MTMTANRFHDLDILLAALCDGTAHPEEVATLESLVDNAESMRYVIEYLQLDGLLRWENGSGNEKLPQNDEQFNADSNLLTPIRVAIVSPVCWPSSTDQPSSMPSPVDSESLPSVAFLSSAFRNTVGFFSQELPFSLIIATLLTGLGLWIASLVYVSNPDKIAKDSLSLPTKSSSLPTKSSTDPKMEIVGRITGMVDCRWADPNTETIRGDNVLLGRKYALVSGLMEIMYGTGAKVILQGPVTYEVESRNGGFLSVGRLTGKVESEAAKGFTVRTPTVTVTDLGTEFGVEVDGSGVTTSHVFQGSVKVVVIDDEGNVGQNNKVGRVNTDQAGVSAKVVDREVLLHADESARTGQKLGDSGRKIVFVRRATVEASNFCRTLPPSESTKYARKSEDYGKLVLSMQPTLYYRMEPPEDGDPKVLYDSAPGKHHGTIHFADGYVDTSPYEQGRFGQSLRLRGPMVGDYALVKDYPKTTDGRLTVSAWVLAMGRVTPAIIAGNWRSNWQQHDGQFVFYFSYLTNGNFAGRGVEENGQQVILQEGQTWESAFPLGTWQHVAQVFDGATMRLYRNGIEVASRPCRGLTPSPSLKWMTIGCEATDSLDRLIGYWQGKIDELSLFNRTLSVEEIRRLSNHVEVRR